MFSAWQSELFSGVLCLFKHTWQLYFTQHNSTNWANESILGGELNHKIIAQKKTIQPIMSILANNGPFVLAFPILDLRHSRTQQIVIQVIIVKIMFVRGEWMVQVHSMLAEHLLSHWEWCGNGMCWIGITEGKHFFAGSFLQNARQWERSRGNDMAQSQQHAGKRGL